MHSVRTLVALALIAMTYASTACGQQKIASLGIGASRTPDSVSYTFSFAFNRTDPSDVEAGPSLWGGSYRGTSLALVPTGEVNVGNGTEMSPNNVLASVHLLGSRRLDLRYSPFDTPFVLLGDVAPSFTADKNFLTKLYYLPVGLQLVTYRTPAYPQVLIMPGVRFDIGHRVLAGANGTNFTRIVPSLSAWWQSFDGLRFEAGGTGYGINGDEAIIANGWHGYGSAGVSLRGLNGEATLARTREIRKALKCTADPVESDNCKYVREPVYGAFGVSIEGKIGYQEPLYRRQSLLAVAFNWYAQ